MKVISVLILVFAILLTGCSMASRGQRTPAVHAIGIYEGTYPPGVRHGRGAHPFGQARVSVEAKTPVVLILSSYEPVNWVFDVRDGAQVKEVILNSYHQSEISGLGEGTVVLREYFGSAYQGKHQRLVEQYSSRKFGVQPVSFQYGYKGGEFVIGKF